MHCCRHFRFSLECALWEVLTDGELLQGFTEEEVLAAATQAAKEAAASSELITQSQVDQGDAQSRYYSLAHSVEEVVKTQPAMLQASALMPLQHSTAEWQFGGALKD